MRIISTCLVLLIFTGVSFAQDLKSDEKDNALLDQILQAEFKGGGFTVVDPMTDLSHLKADKPENLVRSREYVGKGIKIENYDIGPLFDQLIKKNQKPVRLTLKSSPEKGYLVDYDGKFDNYFNSGNGGWEKWHKENPLTQGWTRVSLPAYDEKTGIILLYLGTQYDWLAGSGDLIVYKYKDGKLQELGRVMLWIS
ncbi:MAG: hypothetical protein EHM45_09035 [Desulfobacteraceae bacterium]|nr:MAG: hypothetical protein EHM45_09035 [Desulfobacteraceae bacterium]